MCEVAFQMENKLAWPAEGFMFDDDKHDHLVSIATEATAELTTAIGDIIPAAHLRNEDVHVFHIQPPTAIPKFCFYFLPTLYQLYQRVGHTTQ